MRRFACLALVLLTSSAWAVYEPGTNLRTLNWDDGPRSYRVTVPTGWDGVTPLPLVVDLHGFTSNGFQQEALSGLVAVAEREGFIVTHPSGPGAAWDAGLCCTAQPRDDVGFMRALVAAIAAEGAIDPRRIYVTGLSNGGAMTHRLACDAADLFAAAAPLAFPIPNRPLEECQPSRAMPLLMFMGLNDVLVEYEDGLFGGAVESFDYWSRVNGCADGPPDDVVVSDSGLSRCETRTQCTDGVETGLCSITARTFGGAGFDGHILYLNDDFDLAEIIWSFLSRFESPAEATVRRATLTGMSALKLPGQRRQKAPAVWSFTFVHGTWVADDGAGTVLTGSATPRGRKGRRLDLRLTGGSHEALLAALGSAVEAAALEGEPSLTARVNRKGTRMKVRGKVPLANGTGAPAGAWSVKLKGALATR